MRILDFHTHLDDCWFDQPAPDEVLGEHAYNRYNHHRDYDSEPGYMERKVAVWTHESGQEVHGVIHDTRDQKKHIDGYVEWDNNKQAGHKVPLEPALRFNWLRSVVLSNHIDSAVAARCPLISLIEFAPST